LTKRLHRQHTNHSIVFTRWHQCAPSI